MMVNQASVDRFRSTPHPLADAYGIALGRHAETTLTPRTVVGVAGTSVYASLSESPEPIEHGDPQPPRCPVEFETSHRRRRRDVQVSQVQGLEALQPLLGWQRRHATQTKMIPDTNQTTKTAVMTTPDQRRGGPGPCASRAACRDAWSRRIIVKIRSRPTQPCR
jgi:hypothetical protein